MFAPAKRKSNYYNRERNDNDGFASGKRFMPEVAVMRAIKSILRVRLNIDHKDKEEFSLMQRPNSLFFLSCAFFSARPFL